MKQLARRTRCKNIVLVLGYAIGVARSVRWMAPGKYLKSSAGKMYCLEMESDRKLVHWPYITTNCINNIYKGLFVLTFQVNVIKTFFFNSPTRPWFCSKRIFAIWVLSKMSLVALKVNVWFYSKAVLINNTQYQCSLYSSFDGHKNWKQIN